MRMTREHKAAALDAIAAEIAGCAICKKGKTGLPVPGEGDPDAEVVFVGEAPGKQEAATGRPFIGRSGKLLRELIAGAGLRDEDVFITSPVKYLPTYVTPTDEDVAHAKTHFDRQLDVIDPKVVVVLGAVASLALLGRKLPVGAHHGEVVRQHGRVHFLSYHPAAPLYSPKLRATMETDFAELKKLLATV
jgi:uracil-DNA glycosylase family 4